MHARYHNRYPNYTLIFFTSNLSFDEAFRLKDNASEEETKIGLTKFNFKHFAKKIKKEAQERALKRRFTAIYEDIQTRSEMKQVIQKIIHQLQEPQLLNDEGKALLENKTAIVD